MSVAIEMCTSLFVLFVWCEQVYICSGRCRHEGEWRCGESVEGVSWRQETHWVCWHAIDIQYGWVDHTVFEGVTSLDLPLLNKLQPQPLAKVTVIASLSTTPETEPTGVIFQWMPSPRFIRNWFKECLSQPAQLWPLTLGYLPWLHTHTYWKRSVSDTHMYTSASSAEMMLGQCCCWIAPYMYTHAHAHVHTCIHIHSANNVASQLVIQLASCQLVKLATYHAVQRKHR